MERLAERCENFVGLKVSDAPIARFEQYLLPWLDILVGPEPLITVGLARGAVGAVSALASAFPEIVTAAVANPTDASTETVTALRRQMGAPAPARRTEVRAAASWNPDQRVRPAPLRALTPDERESLLTALSGLQTGVQLQASR